MSLCFITDLHLGRDLTKSWAEPVCMLPASELVQRLKHVLIAERVDCLVLGGDMIEHGDEHHINALVDLFRLIYLPTLVCFGNHDLASADARSSWRAAMTRWPQATLADACVDAGEMQVIGMNTRWLIDHEPREVWSPSAGCLPALSDAQRAWLRETIDTLTRPTAIVLHAPLHTLAMHEPRDGQAAHQTLTYRAAVEAELARAARGHLVKAILGGHVHFASVARHERLLITNSAMSETPACVRVLRWLDDGLQMKNIALAPDDDER